MGINKLEVEKHLVEHAIIKNDSKLTARGIEQNDVDVHNGTIRESFNALVTSDGATVTFTLTNASSGDLTLQFSDGEHIFSTSSGNTIVLTTGTDASPTENFIFILKSDRILTKSTSDWPAGEHTKIGYYLVPSAGFVQTNGVYINQNWNDDISGTDNMGDLAHIGEKLRRLPASYFSGIDGNGTQGYLTPANLDTGLMSTAGVVYQKHRHTFSAVDTSAGDVVLVKNWSGDPFHDITNLFDITEDSNGVAIGNNKFFNLIIWGVANKSGEYSPLMINLPSGSYNTQGGAEADANSFDDFTMPQEFNRESSTGFLIARITIQMKTAGTWVVSSTTDLRGQIPTTATGGVSGIVSMFADNVFTIFDEGDNTKILAFDVGTNVTTGTTRSLEIPDLNGEIALMGVTQSTNFTTTGTVSAEHLFSSDNGVITNRLGVGEVSPESRLEIAGTDDAYITLHNTTDEDILDGRETRIIFKGDRSGGEEHTLAQIEGSHSAAGDTNLGHLVFATNDGSSLKDMMWLSELGQLFIGRSKNDGATGILEIYNATPDLDFYDLAPSNADGSRESRILFRGEKADQTVHTLARIDVEHEGSGDNENGVMQIYTNSGSDVNSPTLALTIDSSQNMQLVGAFTIGGGNSIPLTISRDRDDATDLICTITRDSDTTGDEVVLLNHVEAGGITRYISIKTNILDATAGSIDAELILSAVLADSIKDTLTISGDKIQVAGTAESDQIHLTKPTKRYQFMQTDFMVTSNLMSPPFLGASIVSGIQAGAGVVNNEHPGQIIFASDQSSPAANSGYRYIMTQTSITIGGGEIFELVFKTIGSIHADTLVRMGIHDGANHNAPVDGVWIEQNGTTLDGRTRNNGSGSTTSTSFTLSNNTWYRGKITMNSDATLATYELFTADGTQVWTDTLATNIPTTRATGCGVLGVITSANTSNIIFVDYMTFYIDRNLARGEA